MQGKSAAFVCPDDSPGGNTGVCRRDGSGACTWEHRTCPEVRSCGGVPECERVGGVKGDSFCNYDYNPVCDVGEASPGTCRMRPTNCPPVVAPVCGCEGKTYDNLCEAHSHGVAVKTDGACTKPI
ncbi:MAG: hypothetical protein NVS3B20_24420 [Polyangiales bacterium]